MAKARGELTFLRMSEEPENLVLIYLRRLDERMARIEEDVRDLKGRMTLLEQRVANGFNHLEGMLAQQAGRLDRFGDPMARLERRLDLVPAP